MTKQCDPAPSDVSSTNEGADPQMAGSQTPVPRSILMIVTWFGSGLSPKAPGTMGTLAALPFAALMSWLSGPVWAPLTLCIAALAAFLIGWWASARYVRYTNTQDPGLIVIDEVAAMWLTLAVAPTAPWAYLAGFVYFRFFDILKPWPVCVADRRLHGGFGIMADDILAAVYAAALVWATGLALS